MDANKVMNKVLNDVIEILNNVRDTSSRNSKIEILEKNIDNGILQKVLEYTYNPYKVYGVGKKSLEGVDKLPITMSISKFSNIFSLLDFLSVNNLNNEIKGEVINFLSNSPLHLRELYTMMILKDLRLGATEGTINKVWEDLIPSFELMQGKKWEDRADKINGETILLSVKLDGQRLALIKEGSNLIFKTRQGKIVEGLMDIERESKLLPDGVYDGELLASNEEKLNSKELFTKTRKLASLKGDKTGLIFNVFDYLPLVEFQKGKSKLNCIDRKQQITDIMNDNAFDWIKEVETLEITNDHTRIKYWLDEAIENGQEGCMINLDTPYECKRSNQLLKVKQFHTFDGRILDIYEGENKNKGKLGGIIITYKDIEVKCGSGFSDAERISYFNNPELIIGKIGECNYFEESENQQGGRDLRFCTWNKIREEKDEVSYN